MRSINRPWFLFASLLAALPLGTSAAGPAGKSPSPPTNVRAVRQDFQAARITWDAVGNGMKYFLYASYDREPLEFHKEHDAQPLSDTLAIWDAPRKGPRRFIFYVTAVDPQGHESQPSKQVRVHLGPPPELP